MVSMSRVSGTLWVRPALPCWIPTQRDARCGSAESSSVREYPDVLGDVFKIPRNRWPFATYIYSERLWEATNQNPISCTARWTCSC